MGTIKTLFVLVMVVGVSLANVTWAAGEEWPTKPIELYIAYAPGGSADILARVYVPFMSKELGVPVVIMYKPGAGGAVCCEYIAKSKPDGYTIQDTSYVIPATRRYTVHTTITPSDFTFISSHSDFNVAFVVRKDAPWKTFKEWIEYARKKTGSTYGTNGTGSTSHLVMEWIKKREGLKGVNHVPFEGGSEIIAPLLGGHIDIGTGWGAHIPLCEAGKLRTLLQLSGEPADPDSTKVPYVTDIYPDFPEQLKLSVEIPSGFSGPKGIPTPIVQKLASALRKAINEEAFKTLLKQNKRRLVVWEGEDAFKKVQIVSDTYAAFLKDIGFVKK